MFEKFCVQFYCLLNKTNIQVVMIEAIEEKREPVHPLFREIVYSSLLSTNGPHLYFFLTSI